MTLERAGKEVFEQEITAAGFEKVREPLKLRDDNVSPFRSVPR